jgi:hypothetical protein
MTAEIHPHLRALMIANLKRQLREWEAPVPVPSCWFYRLKSWLREALADISDAFRR